MGITPDGEVYEFARNRLLRAPGSEDASEFCGPAFSPDGRTFFLNVQNPGHTFAITGPFPRRDAGRQRQTATPGPLHRLAPRFTGGLRVTARRLGLLHYQGAAHRRTEEPTS